MAMHDWMHQYPHVAEFLQQDSDVLEGISTETARPDYRIPMPQRYWNALHDLLFAQLQTYSRSTLVEWERELNHWKWPEDFPLQAPHGFATMAYRDAYVLTAPIMQVLCELTTPEERSRAHWIKNLGRSVEEWQAWWEQEGQPHGAGCAVHFNGVDEAGHVNA